MTDDDEHDLDLDYDDAYWS